LELTGTKELTLCNTPYDKMNIYEHEDMMASNVLLSQTVHQPSLPSILKVSVGLQE
jgi:hypothetical protein